MPARMVARWGTATLRKGARRKVREVLGTSREEAPEVLATITAAEYLDKIMDMATDGELRVTVTYEDMPITWPRARQLASGGRIGA